MAIRNNNLSSRKIYIGTNTEVIPNDGDALISGNVGIGIINPPTKLSVDGSIRASNGVVAIGNDVTGYSGHGLEIRVASGIGGVLSYDRTASEYKPLSLIGSQTSFQIGTDTKMFINSSGNVGIGTTSPQSKLQVGDTLGSNYFSIIRGDVDFIGSNKDIGQFQAGTLNISSTTRSSSAPFNQGNGPSLTFTQNGSGYVNGYDQVIGGIKTELKNPANLDFSSIMQFYTHNNSNISPRMTIDNVGNVGIGTTDPEVGLHVKGSAVDNKSLLYIENEYLDGGVFFPAAKFTNLRSNHSYGIVSEFRTEDAAGTDRPAILFSHNHTGWNWAVGQGVYGANDNFSIGSRDVHPGETGASWATPRLTIVPSNGNVGINETSPGAKLEVGGNIAASDQVSVDNRTAISVAHWSGTPSDTGAIKISLPGSHTGNWSMIVLRITTYEYNSNNHTVYYVSGHDWTSGWYNSGVTKIGDSDKNISLGYDSNKDYVIVGETTSSWAYGHVTVDVMAHPSFYTNSMDIRSGWGISQDADLTNITIQSVTNRKVLTSADAYYTESESDDRFVNVTGDTMSGPLSILAPDDPKIVLQTTSGDSSDWNYINFVGRDAVRDGYTGTTSDGDMIMHSDKNSANISITPNGTIFSGNNVGIGTTAPSNKLSLAGSGQTWTDSPGIKIWDSFNSKGWYVGSANNDTPGDFYIRSVTAENLYPVSADQQFTIKQSGNVGIGTISPSDKLDVTDGNAKMVFGAASSDRSLLYFQHNAIPADAEEIGLLDFRGYNDASEDTRYVILTAKAEDVTNGSEDGSLTFQTMADGTATQALTLRSGKVGIGTTSPTNAKVHIVGDGSYVGNVGYNTLTLEDSSGYPGLNLRAGNNNWLIRKTGNNHNLEFHYSADASAQGTGTYGNKFTIDTGGNVVASGTINGSNLSGTNTGDQDLSGYSLISNTPLFTFDSTANLASPDAESGTWTDGSVDDWGNPRIGTSVAVYNDDDGQLEFNVPTGIKTAYLSHLTWSSGGYLDVYGKQADGDLIFLRRINTKQSVENSNHGNIIDHDGSTIVFIGHVGDYPSIRIINKSGRAHLTGLGWSKSELVASEGTGIVNYAQLTGTAPTWNQNTTGTAATASYVAGGNVDGAVASATNADTVDGVHASYTRNSANTIPVRDGNGYLNLGWINTTSGNTTNTLTDVYVNTNDGYIRKATPAHFRSQITDGAYVNTTGDTMTGTLTFNNSTSTKINLNDSNAYWLATATNWGLYWNTSNNQLQFHGAGSTKAFIDLDTGRIDTEEHVIANGNVYANGVDGFVFGTSTSEGEYIRRSGNDIQFIAGGSTRMTVDGDNTGVGIGTTSPRYQLDLAKPQNSSQVDYIALGVNNGPADGLGNNLGSGLIWKTNYTNYTKRSAGVVQIAEGHYFRSGLAFYTNNSPNQTGDWGERMRIDMDGNVGIGTNSPSSKLEVYGSGGTILDIQGSQGQLFSVTDDLTGTLFTVSDISGIPILEVDASGESTFDGNVTVDGDVTATTFNGALSGNASTATSAGTWTTGRTLTIGDTGKSVNGSANVSWTLAEIGAQAAGNYFTDGDTVLNMANNDGLVYNDTNNLMYVKADGTDYQIIDVRGGTMTGGLNMGANTLSGNNFNITGVNAITINDPGEGIIWSAGSSGDIVLATVDDASDNILRLTGTGASLQVGTNTVFHDGYHPNANAWTTARTITLGGDLTGNVSIDGSGDVTLSAQVTNDSHEHSYIKAGGDGPGTEDLNAVANSVAVGRLSYRGYNSSSTNKPPAADNANGVITVGQHSGGYNAQVAFSSDGNMYWRDNPGSTNGSWRTIWDSGNDGSTSGLDADLLDGQEGSYYRNASNLNAGTYPDLFANSTRYNFGLIDGNSSQTRDKLRVWSSSEYTIGMKSGYTFGHLNDYAMSFQMSNTTTRGFWWGDTSHTDAQGAMSLTTTGKATIATSLSIGEGETITTPSSTPLYVNGSATIGGGHTNTGTNTTIAGGFLNTLSGGYGFIGGGYDNCVTKNHSSTVSGQYNTISGTYGVDSFIGSGHCNTISSNRSAIVGGINNTISSDYQENNFIGGGNNNCIGYGAEGVIVGGLNNTINPGQGNNYNGILGGNGNTIGNGRTNTFIIGSGLTATTNYTTYMNNATVACHLQVGGTTTMNTTTGRIDATNDVIAYATSDRRLKENIQPIKNALCKVVGVSGNTFDWKPLSKEEIQTIHGNTGKDVGVIAQEIEAILPEAVTTRDSGYKAVNYEKIVPLLIEAIKEQQKQIDELKSKL